MGESGGKPDVTITANDALTQLVENAEGELQAWEISWAQEARQSPQMLTNTEINEIIGLYGSDRNIQLINGELTYLRGRRPAQCMLCVGIDSC